MKYRITRRQPLYRGFFQLDACTIEHDSFAGGSQTVVREHMERGDAVAVLLYDPAADEVLLIRQFRIGPAVRGDEPWLVEIVAGMVDAGESPEAAALRETVEEAGYRPGSLRHLGRYYSTPGGSSERIDLYYGEVDQGDAEHEGGGLAHEEEDIEVFWLARETAMQWLAEGRINSGAPMLALLLAFGSGGLRRGEHG